MTRNLVLAALLALVLSACVASNGSTVSEGVQVYHDDDRGVTCWTFDSGSYAGGIDCITDAEVGR